MIRVVLSQQDVDEAARFLQKQMNDAKWDRMPEHLKERYRDKVKHILILCGLQIEGMSGR